MINRLARTKCRPRAGRSCSRGLRYDSAPLTYGRSSRSLKAVLSSGLVSGRGRHSCRPGKLLEGVGAAFCAVRGDSGHEHDGHCILVDALEPFVCAQQSAQTIPGATDNHARAGEITGFTGIDDPYEEPTDAELVIDTADVSVDEAVARILALLG